MSRVGVPAAVLFLVALFAASHLSAPVSADSSMGSRMTLIVADAEAVRRVDGGVGLVQSLVGLMATLRDDDFIAFSTLESPTEVVGPFRGSNVRLPEFESSIESMLQTPASRRTSVVEALSEMRSILAVHEAAPGSSVHVVAGGSSDADFTRHISHLPGVAESFAANGWYVDSLVLPDSTDEATAFLQSLASASGGQLSELSTALDLGAIGDSILRKDASGSLYDAGSRSLGYGEVMSTLITVLPGTQEATLLIFKVNPFGSLVLTNPSGLNVSANDAAISLAVETPNMVAWQLVDPAPGRWRVDARGLTGPVSKWVHYTNRFTLVLRSPGPVALDELLPISAYVKDGEEIALLSDARMFANITAPDGVTRVFELHDNGKDADSRAQDGYFATILPPLEARGRYEVELELAWNRYEHTITSLTQLHADHFPTIDMQPVAVEELKPGVRTQVATVSIHVDGDPYPVETGALVPALVSEAGKSGVVELEPRRLYGDGPAWQFDVFFTASEAGRHALSLTLSLNYAGRDHAQTSRPFTLDAVSPVVAEPTAPEPKAPEPVEQPSAPVKAPAAPEPTPEGFPWSLAVSLALSLAVTVAAGVYWLTRTKPHGYLYDDHGRPQVDFSEVQRHPLMNLFFRDTVRGRELGIPTLDGLNFRFSRDHITVSGRGRHPTVRVNNQPLVDEIPVYDKSWIGTEGKLFTFMTKPLPVPAGGSDD